MADCSCPRVKPQNVRTGLVCTFTTTRRVALRRARSPPRRTRNRRETERIGKRVSFFMCQSVDFVVAVPQHFEYVRYGCSLHLQREISLRSGISIPPHTESRQFGYLSPYRSIIR